MTSVLLSPFGLITLSSTCEKYQIHDILDLDDLTVQTFAEALHLTKNKRYQILYSLAINNLLILPNGSDALEYVKKKHPIIDLIDNLITDKLGFKSITYNLTFAGKRSSLFYMLESLVTESKNTDYSFERSFHILPDKFYNGSDKIDNHEEYRGEIKSMIESNFILNEQILECTFNLIDEIYFSNLLKYRLQASGKKISFKISYQMSSCAGSMKSKANEYCITISNRLNEANSDPIDAFISTLQHEMTHLIVYLEIDRLGPEVCNNDNFKSHGVVFKDIGSRFFGVIERTHSFFDKPEISSNKSFIIGQRVYFDPNTSKGKLAGIKRVYGKVTKINPKTIAIETEGGHGNWKVNHSSVNPA